MLLCMKQLLLALYFCQWVQNDLRITNVQGAELLIHEEAVVFVGNDYEFLRKSIYSAIAALPFAEINYCCPQLL